MDRGTRVQAEQRGRWGEQVPFQPRWPMAEESWSPKETCQEHLQLGSELPLSELPTSHAEASFLLPTTLTLALTLAFSKMILFFSQKLLICLFLSGHSMCCSCRCALSGRSTDPPTDRCQ